jgi:hypothetical protein
LAIHSPFLSLIEGSYGVEWILPKILMISKAYNLKFLKSAPMGARKAYKVFGLIDYFSGQFFYKAHTGRFNSQSYAAFLLDVLSQTTQPVGMIQDGAQYHTSKAIKRFSGHTRIA